MMHCLTWHELNVSFLQAETATDLIALDGCSPTQPDEKIVLSGSKKNAETEDKPFCAESLSSEIRKILTPAVEWLKGCKVIMGLYCGFR